MSFRSWILGHFLLLCLIVLGASVSLAEPDLSPSTETGCDLASSPTATLCVGGAYYTAIGPALTSTPLTAYGFIARSPAHSQATTAIDAWGICRYIDNASNEPVSVSFSSDAEWSTFLHNLPSGVTAVPCAIPANPAATIVSGSNCGSPQPVNYSISEPYYARPGTQIPLSAPLSFTCTVSGLCGNGNPSCGVAQTWTETAIVTLIAAPQADANGHVPWSTTTSHTGIPPHPNPAPINGSCGIGHGNCVTGTASGAAASILNGPWTCNGENGGANSECSDSAGSCGHGRYACSTGTPHNKNDILNTSSWVCSGINGNSTSTTCSMCDDGYSWYGNACVQITHGICGNTRYTCSAGAVTYPGDKNGTSTWTCSGENGGTTSPSCVACDSNYVWNGNACVMPVDGSCGSVFNTCVVGTPQSNSSDETSMSWICTGSNGGNNHTCRACDTGQRWNGASCTAVISGLCGNITNPCSSGSAVSLATYGFLSTWSCQASNGGINSNICLDCSDGFVNISGQCVPTINGACGLGENACMSGTPSNESTTNGKYTWNCSGSGAGTSASCSSSMPIMGLCGDSATMCASGISTNSHSTSVATTWTCYGNSEVKRAECSSCKSGTVNFNGTCVQPQDGECGNSDWTCNAGSVYAGSSDDVNDYWYCTGTKGGNTSGQCNFIHRQSR